MPILPTKIYTIPDDPEAQAIKTQLILWNNIYHRRKYRWLSQSKLAEDAKITQAIVSELENWDYNPSIELLTKITTALNIEMELLVKEKFNWRFLETMDYFISRIEKVDVLKLMKLIFFADCHSEEITGYKLTGIDYYRRYAGPFNSDIYIADKFFDKENKYFNKKQTLIKRIALNKDDEKFLDKIVKRYKDYSSAEIRDASYDTKRMKWCKKTNEYMMWKKVF